MEGKEAATEDEVMECWLHLHLTSLSLCLVYLNVSVFLEDVFFFFFGGGGGGREIVLYVVDTWGHG